MTELHLTPHVLQARPKSIHVGEHVLGSVDLEVEARIEEVKGSHQLPHPVDKSFEFTTVSSTLWGQVQLVHL